MEKTDICDIVDYMYLNARLYKNSIATSETQCCSEKKTKLSFLPEQLRSKIQETLENIFTEESGNFKLMDMNAISCPYCDGHLQDGKVLLHQSNLFSSKMVEVECYRQSIWILFYSLFHCFLSGFLGIGERLNSQLKNSFFKYLYT